MKRMQRILARVGLDQVPPMVRKIIVTVIGTTILLVGVVLIVLPGPAFIVIPIGLGILATEFVWAKRVIKRGRILLRRSGGRRRATWQHDGARTR
jgi:tellurite resistance protein TerC